MSTQMTTCPRCNTPASNPNARNCSQCGYAFESYAPLHAGALVGGQYKIIKPIGRGGAGSIYLAEDTRTFNRRCVLKRLLTMHSPADRARFAAEVQTVTRLRHPNIAQVYAYFEEGTNAFIVMEYIAGADLEQKLSRTLDSGMFVPGRAYSLDQVLRDGIAVCSILEHLHSRNPPVVHCDIKPANLIRDSESHALFLVDFGAAAPSGSGENYGTPGYAAPEMYRGVRGPASDIYALAATLYHMLTDDDPCEHPHQFPKLQAQPPLIRELLMRALADKPEQRPSSTDMRLLLERCLTLPTTDVTLRTNDGQTITTINEFVQVTLNSWSWALNALTDGKIQRWLAENGLFQELQWLNQSRLTLQPEQVLHLLLRKLDPNLQATEVRVGTQKVELPASASAEAVPLWCVARNGVATIRVASAPTWVRHGPHQITLRPGEPQAFYLSVDPVSPVAVKQSASLTLEANIGTRSPQRLTVSVVTVAATSSQQAAPASIGSAGRMQSNPVIKYFNSFWALWSLLFCIPVLLLSTQLTNGAGIGAFAVGGTVGCVLAVLYSTDMLDMWLMIGLCMFGAMIVGTLVTLLAQGGFALTPVTLLTGAVSGIATGGLYIWIRS